MRMFAKPAPARKPRRFTGCLDETAYWTRVLSDDERTVLMYEALQGSQISVAVDIQRYRDAYLQAVPRMRVIEHQRKIAQLNAIQVRQRAYLQKYGWWQ